MATIKVSEQTACSYQTLSNMVKCENALKEAMTHPLEIDGSFTLSLRSPAREPFNCCFCVISVNGNTKYMVFSAEATVGSDVVLLTRQS